MAAKGGGAARRDRHDWRSEPCSPTRRSLPPDHLCPAPLSAEVSGEGAPLRPSRLEPRGDTLQPLCCTVLSARGWGQAPEGGGGGLERGGEQAG